MNESSTRFPVNKSSSCNTSHIGVFLHKAEFAGALLDEIQEREKLLQQIRAAIPAEIGSHCIQAAIQDDKLTLCVDSPAWAIRLRLHASTLIEANESRLPGVRECRVRVLPAHTAVAGHNHEPVRPIYPAASRFLNQAAECVASRQLADSLKRLANTLSSSGGI